jgi:signal transduction histidine kinase
VTLDTLARIADVLAQGIARDLYDSTGQDLVAQATNLGLLRGTIPSNDRKAHKLVARAEALTKE